MHSNAPDSLHGTVPGQDKPDFPKSPRPTSAADLGPQVLEGMFLSESNG